MTITDAGPLIAIIDRDDRDHEACVAALRGIVGPMVTSWPAFTEAMYLLAERAGWSGQERLWSLVQRGDLRLSFLEEASVKRSYELMKKYRDVPMDLADATLVSLAEHLGLSRVFTLDDDFRIYRLQGRKAFKLVP